MASKLTFVCDHSVPGSRLCRRQKTPRLLPLASGSGPVVLPVEVVATDEPIHLAALRETIVAQEWQRLESTAGGT